MNFHEPTHRTSTFLPNRLVYPHVEVWSNDSTTGSDGNDPDHSVPKSEISTLRGDDDGLHRRARSSSVSTMRGDEDDLQRLP